MKALALIAQMVEQRFCKPLMRVRSLLGALAFLGLATVAHAQTDPPQYQQFTASATHVMVVLSTSAPTRVDDFQLINGTTAHLVLTGRNELKLQSLLSGPTFYCSYSVNVSSIMATATTANFRLGSAITPGSVLDMALNAVLAFYCLPDNSGSLPVFFIDQARAKP